MSRLAYAPLRRAAGVGLITAVFLLVGLAALGVALVSVFTGQQSAILLDEQNARAYQAARAGVEWGLFQYRSGGDACPNGGAATSFALPANSSLADFVVTVTCSQVGVAPLQRAVIRATACNLQPANGSCPNWSNDPHYVQRVIEAER